MRGGAIRLAVHDTGPGICRHAAAPVHALLAGRRLDHAPLRRHRPGLSICRELAALMGGSVGVNSAPATAAPFWADLPLATATPPAALSEDALAPLQGGRVLIAEDNRSTC